MTHGRVRSLSSVSSCDWSEYTLDHSVHVAYITYTVLVAGDAWPLPSQTQFHSRVRSRITFDSPSASLGLLASYPLLSSRRNALVNNDFGRLGMEAGNGLKRIRGVEFGSDRSFARGWIGSTAPGP